MKRIVLDINGLDLGEQVFYDASYEFLKKHSDLEITLIGNTQYIKTKEDLKNLILVNNNLKFTDPKNIRMSLKENTSMNEAITGVVEGKFDGVISGGDSGSYISSLTFKSGRIEGISRPAFMPIITALNGRKLLLTDVGANLEVKPENLHEWAKLASVFSSIMFNIKNPDLTLLNIGTEEYKGFEYVKEAASLIKNDSSLNYIGFSESRNLLKGEFDVAIIDGYGGNLILKSYEGAVLSFKDSIKESALKKLKTKIGLLLLKPVFIDIMKKLDYRNIGAAWVIGVKSLALKIHGSSDQKAIYSALTQMYDAIDKNLISELNKVKNV
ncbi:phosphate acyltransferase [Mycoplasmopsis canis]|uniref:phosphate acyltransferase PlsX n=1 Tax=Mycoplasmopsis canis TaxID=29555 RepID=UPI000624E8EF|nr:phosphate acyltransferase PlsX [Mycoplasmopsis canis]AKF41211.1 phosphate acyltransferase [Mycoplasmopsis canis]